MEPTNASSVAAPESAQQPADQQSAPASQSETNRLSGVALIERANARLAQIAALVASANTSIASLADAAARGTATAETLSQIGDHEEEVASLEAERVSIEKVLVPIRAAIANVEAEEAAAAAAAERVEAKTGLGSLISALVVSALDFEQAVAQVAALAKRRRELKKQFRDALNIVVTDPQPRGAINAQAEGMFTETPNLEQFISLDAGLVVGSASLAADRAQKVRDRIAEATD